MRIDISVGGTSLRQVLVNINTANHKVTDAVSMGLKKAGLLLQRLSMQIVPVDTGNLRGSAFTRSEGSGFKTVVTVGYTAAYAVYVHENLDAAHGAAYNLKHAEQIERGDKGFHNRGENQQAKYLEQPARQHLEELATVLREEVQGALS